MRRGTNSSPSISPSIVDYMGVFDRAKNNINGRFNPAML